MNYLTFLRASFIFIASATYCACFAVASDSELTEIIVTAKGVQTIEDTLVTAHVINFEDIELIQAKDLTTLLDDVSGLSITDTGGRGSTTGVFLRGTSASQTIVLVDGVRVGSATLGAAALNTYPIEAIEKVEVVKGPLSGIYGADAVGGVIQLFTRKGDTIDAGFGSLAIGVGSDSLQESSLTLHGKAGEHSVYLSAHQEESDGIDRTSIVTGGNDDLDSFEQQAVSLGVRSQLIDHTRLNLSLLSTDSTVEFDNTFGEDTGFYTDTETFSSALNIETRLSDRWTWKNNLGINSDESITPAFASEFKTDRNSLGSEFSFSIDEHSVVSLGADFYEEEISPNDAFPVFERDNIGTYLLLQRQLGKVSFVGNLRYDDNSAYGSDTNGSVALNYNFSERLRATVSHGTAFVAPSFNFLYFPFFGNPDLLPEESETSEVSLRGTTSIGDWRVSAYQTKIENLFSFDPATFLAANIGQAEIQGVEVELKTKLFGWNLAANADLLDAKNSKTGVELDDRAQRKLTVSAIKSWDKLSLRLAADGESHRYDNNGTELSGFVLFGVSGIYKLNDRFTVQAAVDNLFDKDYTVNLVGANDRYRTEGRQARVNLRLNF